VLRVLVVRFLIVAEFSTFRLCVVREVRERISEVVVLIGEVFTNKYPEETLRELSL
jgi:hypothetical protein